MSQGSVEQIEEFQYATQLERAAQAGDTDIFLRAPMRVTSGKLLIGAHSSPTEIVAISSVEGRRVTLSSGLLNAHAVGALVTRPLRAPPPFAIGWTSDPFYDFDVYGASVPGATGIKWLAHFDHDARPTVEITDADIQALHVTLDYQSDQNISGSYLSALHGNLVVSGSGNMGPQMIAGVWGAVTYTGTGTSIDHVMGVRGEVTASSGSGVKMSALYAATSVIDAAGVVAEVFGLYIEDQFDTEYPATTVYNLYSEGLAAIGIEGSIEFVERADPSAPPANRVYLYAKDNGAGKTQLMALFSSGAAQQVAIQP